jgi:hypothetical protein
MKIIRKQKGEKGFMLIGLALGIIAIFSILIFAIQSNMNLFFTNSNRSKAFYDAEIAIEKMALKLRDSYDMARPVAPKLTVGGPFYVISNPTDLKFNKKFYLPQNIFCVDRSDGFGGDTLSLFKQICLDYTKDLEYTEIHPNPPTGNWSEIKEAFQYAVYKLINDLAGPTIAYAQEMSVYRPDMPPLPPKITLDLAAALTAGDLITYYDNFNCTPNAGTSISDCMRFRFCTKLSPCAADEYIYQTIIFRHGPVSDIEN